MEHLKGLFTLFLYQWRKYKGKFLKQSFFFSKGSKNLKKGVIYHTILQFFHLIIFIVTTFHPFFKDVYRVINNYAILSFMTIIGHFRE